MKKNSNRDHARRIVQACKDRLRTEQDPIARHQVAIIGNEFNTLLMELDDVQFLTCDWCGNYLPVEKFEVTHRLYKTNKGLHEFTGRRRQCKKCTHKYKGSKSYPQL